jgi:hypothetical protein
MYSVLSEASKKAFPTKLRGALAKIETFITKELSRGSYSPADVPKSPLVKKILALGDADRRAIILSLCERIVWREEQDIRPWHAHAILRWSMGGKRLAWTQREVEQMMALAKKLRKEAFYLPINRIVPNA